MDFSGFLVFIMFHDVLCMHLFFGHSCTTLLIDSNRTQKDFQAVNESCLVKLPTCNWHAVSYIPRLISVHFICIILYIIVYNQYAGMPQRDD